MTIKISSDMDGSGIQMREEELEALPPQGRSRTALTTTPQDGHHKKNKTQTGVEEDGRGSELAANDLTRSRTKLPEENRHSGEVHLDSVHARQEEDGLLDINNLNQSQITCTPSRDSDKDKGRASAITQNT